MNYRKIHDNIIFNAKNRSSKGYIERHHIIPKCIGGLDAAENIVELTAKEHYLIHKLLVKIYPNEKCLMYAFWLMSHRVSGTFTSSKIYAEAKEFVSKNMRKNVGTKEAIKKMSESRKGQRLWLGKTHSEESKQKMSESAKNRVITKENENKRREGISKGHLGRKASDKAKENIRKSKLGNKNPMFGKVSPRSKKVYQYNLDNDFIKEWPNAKIAANSLNLNYKAINLCCNKKSKSSGGYFWTYNKLK